MIFKDGKTFSAYVRSKLHSGYITLPYMLSHGRHCEVEMINLIY